MAGGSTEISFVAIALSLSLQRRACELCSSPRHLVHSVVCNQQAACLFAEILGNL